MGLHPQAEALLDYLDAFGDPPIETSTPKAVRVARRKRLQPPTIEVHEIREVDAGGVPARLYRPNDRQGLGLLVYFHGGGWVIGDLDTHDHVARALAVESGHAVLSVDYRLAPEHPFPAALDDAATATHWAYEHAETHGCDPALLAIGGDSAGGNLAAVVAQTEKIPLRCQLLVYPVMDARCGSATYAEFADGPLLTAAGMRWYIGHYLSGNEGSAEDPRVSPLLADDAAVAGTPPALVITPELDPLRDEGEAYARRLVAAGVPTTHRRYDGVFHGFFSFAAALDAGRDAVTTASEALAASLGR